MFRAARSADFGEHYEENPPLELTMQSSLVMPSKARSIISKRVICSRIMSNDSISASEQEKRSQSLTTADALITKSLIDILPPSWRLKGSFSFDRTAFSLSRLHVEVR